MNTALAIDTARNTGPTFSCSGQIESLSEDMGRIEIKRITTMTRADNEAAIKAAAAVRGFTATFTEEDEGWTRVDLIRA